MRSTLRPRNLAGRKSIKGVFGHLFEQGLFDEPADEEKKEDKPEGEEEDKPEGEEDKPEGGEDKPEKKEEEKKEDKKTPKPTTAQKAAAEDSVRTEIQKYLIRAKSDAEAALAAEDPEYVKSESKIKSLKLVYRRKLWEAPGQESVPLDLQVFASQVYNLIANWKNMFDMPAIILNNAFLFLQDEYQNDKIVEEFKDVMRKEYPDVKIPAPPGEEDLEPRVPVAVGARTPAG